MGLEIPHESILLYKDPGPMAEMALRKTVNFRRIVCGQ